MNEETNTPRHVQGGVIVALLVFLAATELLIGLRTEHIVAAGALGFLTVVGGRALRFVLLFAPVVATGITYDLFRLAVPLRGEIHVADLHAAEVAWFGVDGMAPAMWFATRTHPVLDAITGVAYITYLYIPMLLAVAFFWIDHDRMKRIAHAFFFTNLVGLMVYLAYPAAPPWYVMAHGLGPANLEALPSAAGAARFDALFGITYFEQFYARSANVFGAMPSLHVAYPASALFALWGRGRRWTWPLALFIAIVGFSAVYLQHHYVFDVVAGIGCALAGFAVARWLSTRSASEVAATARGEGHTEEAARA